MTEGGAIHSDRAVRVSSGRSSRESDEGPNSKGATSRTHDSMSAKRQKNQLVLAFTEEGRSEAPKASQEGTESRTAKCETERPASHEQLMEEVCERENCWQAYKRVKANKGSPGIDGMKVGELSDYLKQRWPSIREQPVAWDLPTTTGATGGNPEAGRRGGKAWHPDGAGSIHSAGGDAGTATQMGPDVLRTQSRVPAETLCTSSGCQGTTVHR